MSHARLVVLACLAASAASAAAAINVDSAAAETANARLRAALQTNPNLVSDPNGVMVRLRSDLAEDAVATVLAQTRGTVVISYDIVPGLMKIYTPMGTARAIDALKNNPAVLYAEPDYIVHAIAIPNDTHFGLMYGLRNTGQAVNGSTGVAGADTRAYLAWDSSTGDPNFVIADIDTGMQTNHPDLALNVWTNPGETAGNGIDDDGNGYIDDINGWDFFENNSTPQDSGSHGTHTGGTIGAVGNNGIGVVGVNWRCKLMVLKFLGPNGGSTSAATLCVQYARNKGVKVSNNSWGGGPFSQSLYDAINAARFSGHIFVAAAGNAGTNNDTSPFYPAAFNLDNIITVAAVDNRDLRASFSNYGATSVDLGAPGVNIASCVPTNGYAYMSGTSMAAPHVSGAVALVYQANPTWTYSQVRSRILSTVRLVPSMSGVTATGGVLNIQAALGSANTAPQVTILSPANGSSSGRWADVTFSGSAIDTQDGNISANIVWTSNLQGVIGNGASFTRNDLNVGNHTITASVTDAGGLPGNGVVQVNITAATIPAAPSNAVASSPGAGAANVTWADNSGNEQQFEVRRQTLVGSTWKLNVFYTTTRNATSFGETGLAPNRYRYQIRAKNSAGNSAYSNWSTAIVN
jgi:subtilisin family serine protease